MKYVGNMTLSSFLVRAAIFAMPGLLLLAGGPSPAMPNADALNDPARTFLEIFSPYNWCRLVVCSGLICLPGLTLYLLSDFIPETDRILWPPHVLRSTPHAAWKLLGYFVAVALSIVAFIRAVHLWTA